MFRASSRLALVVFLAACPVALAGQGLPVAPPESVGMSSERLARLTHVMDDYTKSKQIAGTVTLVARAGRLVYFEAAGDRDIEGHAPMTKDTIFRIASQSKAITSVAAMTLVEEGRLLLTDPVSPSS